jgi:hypothetical protein
VAFSGCKDLESLCLPASLTVLSEDALFEMPFLKSLTFESGSRLREIQNSAFGHCQSLKSLFLPSSVTVLTGSAFLWSSITEIVIDAANPHYFISRRFLIKFDGMTLIRSFGNGGDLSIDCLSDLDLIQIGPDAFSCSAPKSICIPASIEILGEECFSYCFSLSQILFESGSKLTEIGIAAFFQCSSLTSICIPANVGNIPKNCFCCCQSLVKVWFESGSKLTRIEDEAFVDCRSLRSFVIPPQLEIMACGVFSGCISLSELIFDLPSRLKQIDLPPSAFGSLFIPDSAEIVLGGIGKHVEQNRLLQFGRGSCLMTIELRPRVDLSDCEEDRDTESNAFVRLSEEVLRRFRCQFGCF